MTSELPPEFPQTLRPLAAEIHTYFRELPRLLATGEDGRVVVVRGGELFGVWDTHQDAIQYGYSQFPDGRFLAQEVDGRLLDAFGAFFAPSSASGAA